MKILKKHALFIFSSFLYPLVHQVVFEIVKTLGSRSPKPLALAKKPECLAEIGSIGLPAAAASQWKPFSWNPCTTGMIQGSPPFSFSLCRSKAWSSTSANGVFFRFSL